jgi:hypothetical protein
MGENMMADDRDPHGVPGLDGVSPELAETVTAINCAFTEALVSIARDGVAQPGGRVSGALVVEQFVRGFVAFDVSVHGLRFIDGPDLPRDPEPPPGGMYL